MNNIIAFERPLPKPPSLEFVRLRLILETCALIMTVRDEAGREYVIEYGITAKAADFDLARLVAAWEGWRGCVGRAS